MTAGFSGGHQRNSFQEEIALDVSKVLRRVCAGMTLWEIALSNQ
jgi:hypothetical protein